MDVHPNISKFCKNFEYNINDLSEKFLHENIIGFYYKSKSKYANISFYILPKTNKNNIDFEKIHKIIWSENKADLYITLDESGGEIYYAKSLPENALKKDIKIGDFSYGIFESSETQKSYEEFQKKDVLSKIGVDSGLFLETYRNRLREIQKKKKRTVDQALINTINYLRTNVSDYINIKNKQERKEIIQVLIDRSIFIKFLEDRLLLPKSVYEEVDSSLDSYEDILKSDDVNILNHFYEVINKRFNGDLFKEPRLDKRYFTEKSLTTILNLFIKGAEVTRSKSGDTYAQLPLFDYEFNIIPVELLSNIYESFLEDKREEEGIYYTPDPIIDIILKDTLDEYIVEKGSFPKILDPSCGSGNFLVRAFKKLIHNQNNIHSSLEERARLLQNCIFGIDKDPIAARITIFSLYMSLFDDLNQEIGNIDNFEFPKLLTKNILVADSIDESKEINFINNKHEKIEKFDIIIGNPPWGGIKKNTSEYTFCKENEDKICDNEKSQAFIVKVSTWSHAETRFGLIIKGTNFLNVNNHRFIDYFFSNFTLEKYYDLTKARNIIFDNANFSSAIVIYRQKDWQESRSEFLYYRPIESRLSKDLKILFLENEKIDLNVQPMDSSDLFIKLLSGNKWDVELINKLQKYPKISKIFNPIIHQGAIIKDEREFRKNISKIKNVNDLGYSDDKSIKIANKLKEMGFYERFIHGDSDDFKKLYKEFMTSIVTDSKVNGGLFPLIKPANITNYNITKPTTFIDYGPWLGMPRDKSLFEGKRIYIRETIIKPYRLCAAFCDDNSISDHNYIFKVDDEPVQYFFLSLFNSLLASYYLSFTSPRYATKQNPEVSKINLENLPYPKFIDNDVLQDVVLFTKNIQNYLNKNINENDIKELIEHLKHKYFIKNIPTNELDKFLYIQDELIFEFYGLNGKERQRVRDYFIPENEMVTYNDLGEYAKTFKKILSPYIVKDLELYYQKYIPQNRIIDFSAIEFIIGEEAQLKRKKSSTYKTIFDFIGQELIRNKDIFFIPGGRFEIYQDDCLFIIKPNVKKSWSKTKAIENAISELEKIRMYYAR